MSCPFLYPFDLHPKAWKLFVSLAFQDILISVKRTYYEISFPPLTEEQEKELEALKNMKEEDIDTNDIPEVDFSNAQNYYELQDSDKTKYSE